MQRCVWGFWKWCFWLCSCCFQGRENNDSKCILSNTLVKKTLELKGALHSINMMKMILVTIFININLSLEAVWPPKCISLVTTTCINFWYHFLINSFPFGCQPTIILNSVHCHTTLYVPNSKVGKWPRPPTRAYFFSASIKNDYQTVIGPIRVRIGLFLDAGENRACHFH